MKFTSQQKEEITNYFNLQNELYLKEQEIKKIQRQIRVSKSRIRANFTCGKCKRKEPQIKLERDHIVSKKFGGSDEEFNIQILCSGCNRDKGKFFKKYEYKYIDISTFKSCYKYNRGLRPHFP